MIIPIDPAAFEAAGLGYADGEREGEFTIPALSDKDDPTTVRVIKVEGGLQFFPLRHSGQKRVLVLLGLS
jgi:hypothetical protein